MRSNTRLAVESKTTAPFFVAAPNMSRVCELKSEHESEVLEFLGIRPVHTVVMTSFIRDNGMVSSLNRGTFYGYRNANGRLEAVALIGHSTLVEARTDESLRALAHVARASVTPIHLIMSAGDVATSFWSYAYGPTRTPSLTCTELLFEIGFPFLVQECEYEVRLARPEELEIVAKAHAEVAEIECGVNPMLRDREGFLKRVAQRIERGRVFVVFDDGKLVFKADVIAETDAVSYLEGIWVGPEYRGNGIAPKCLSQVCMWLLERTQRVCLLSNVEFKHAHRSFAKAGMRNTDACTTLFV